MSLSGAVSTPQLLILCRNAADGDKEALDVNFGLYLHRCFIFDAYFQRLLAAINGGDQEQLHAALGAFCSYFTLFMFPNPERDSTALTPSVIEFFHAESKEHDTRSLVLTQILSVCLLPPISVSHMKLLFRPFTTEAAQSIPPRSLFRSPGRCRFEGLVWAA